MKEETMDKLPTAALVCLFFIVAGCTGGQSKDANEALLEAASENDLTKVKFALAKGADINCQNEKGFTPLYYAVCSEPYKGTDYSIEVREYLIAMGADVNLKNHSGHTVLHVAASLWHTELAGLLLSNGAEVNVKDNEGYTPLEHAIYGRTREQSQEICKLLRKYGAKSGEPYRADLFEACRDDNATKLRELLAKGGNVKSKDFWNNTLLHYGGSKEVAEILIAEEIDVSAKNDDMATTLHWVRNAEIAEMLIGKGLDVNAKDKKGTTPLHCAAFGETEKADVAALLIEKGAQVNAADSKGRTPLLHAAIFGHIKTAELLIKKGASLEGKDMFSPLHAAAGRGNLEIVLLLINNGANVNSRDDRGETPLHHASREHAESVELLIKKGADVNVPDQGGATPLHNAVYADNMKIAELLVKAGADLKAEDEEEGRLTPLECAKSEEMKELLRSHADKINKELQEQNK